MNMFLESVFAGTLARSLILIKKKDVAEESEVEFAIGSALRLLSAKSQIRHYIIRACSTDLTV